MSDNPRGGVSPVTTRVMNLAQFLSQSARRNPEEIGFVWRDSHWTWRDMEARVNAFAAALRDECGVVKGDRVLVQSANCNQMFESMFACFRLGAVWVPANYRQSPDEVAYLAKASGARGMICGAGFAGHAAACEQHGKSKTMMVASFLAGRVAATNLVHRRAAKFAAPNDECLVQ